MAEPDEFQRFLDVMLTGQPLTKPKCRACNVLFSSWQSLNTHLELHNMELYKEGRQKAKRRVRYLDPEVAAKHPRKWQSLQPTGGRGPRGSMDLRQYGQFNAEFARVLHMPFPYRNLPQRHTVFKDRTNALLKPSEVTFNQVYCLFDADGLDKDLFVRQTKWEQLRIITPRIFHFDTGIGDDHQCHLRAAKVSLMEDGLQLPLAERLVKRLSGAASYCRAILIDGGKIGTLTSDCWDDKTVLQLEAMAVQCFGGRDGGRQLVNGRYGVDRAPEPQVPLTAEDYGALTSDWMYQAFFCYSAIEIRAWKDIGPDSLPPSSCLVYSVKLAQEGDDELFEPVECYTEAQATGTGPAVECVEQKLNGPGAA